MRRVLTCFAAILAATASISSAGHAQGANNLLPALANWDFKAGDLKDQILSAQSDSVNISVAGTDGPRDGRFQVGNIPLVLEHSYRFHCEVSASTNCQIEIALVPSTGVLRKGAFDDTIPIGSDWTSVDETFVADGIGMNSATMVFFVGGCQDIYKIRNVGIYSLDPSSPQAAPTVSAPTAEILNKQPQKDGWNIELNGRAQAGPIFSADGLIIDVDQPDGNAADVQYAQEGVEAANGATYMVHFRARSTKPRTIHVEVDDMTNGHPAIGLSRDAQITPTWQDFNLTFTASHVVSGKARIALLLGGDSGPIQISQATFANPTLMSGPASNQVAAAPNALGGLSPVATWNLDTQGEAEAMVTPAPTGAVVEIDRADGTPAHIILRQDGIALADGKTYELQFKAKSTLARQVPVIAQVDGGPGGGNYRMIGCNDTIRLTPEWQDYDVKFTALGPVPAHSRIAFLLGGAASTVEFSDVALQNDKAPAETASIAP